MVTGGGGRPGRLPRRGVLKRVASHRGTCKGPGVGKALHRNENAPALGPGRWAWGYCGVSSRLVFCQDCCQLSKLSGRFLPKPPLFQTKVKMWIFGCKLPIFKCGELIKNKKYHGVKPSWLWLDWAGRPRVPDLQRPW